MKINLPIILFLFGCAMKLFSQPDEEWVRRYNGPGNNFDIVTKLIVGNHNDLFVYGNSSGIGTLYDFVIINYDLKGNIKWTKTFNGSGNSTDQINSACIDIQNNSYVTGFTTDSTLKSSFTTAKYDSSGNILWMREFNEGIISNSYGQDITIDSYGNVFACGAIRYTVTGKYSVAVLKYSPEGNLLDKIIFDSTGTTESIPVKIRINTSDDILVAGSVKNSSNNKDMFVRSFNNFPVISWTKTISGSSGGDDEITDMILDNENNIYVCGSIRINILPDYYYTKLNADGLTYWDGSYNGTGNNSDIPSSIVVDTSGNTYITGFSKNNSAPGSEDILTIKLSTSGSIVWNNVYNGPGNGTDQGISLALDDAGNAYIGGGSDKGNINLIYALLKYNYAGYLEWTKNYSVSAATEDFIYDVKLDKANNIYVTGISMGTGSAFDFATIKYSQSTGINSNNEIIPTEFTLYQNYPNPFNPVTHLEFGISDLGFVSLRVFDILGKEVACLVNEGLHQGIHTVEWNASEMPSGVYFYKLEAGGVVLTKRMLLIK